LTFNRSLKMATENVVGRYPSSVIRHNREWPAVDRGASGGDGLAVSRLSLVVDPEERYLALWHRFPLRPIRDAARYRAAIEVLDQLFELGSERSAEEEDYFAVLALLAWDYENRGGEGP
jgi:hypothetical protein